MRGRLRRCDVHMDGAKAPGTPGAVAGAGGTARVHSAI
jgi:hypothetical protein